MLATVGMALATARLEFSEDIECGFTADMDIQKLNSTILNMWCMMNSMNQVAQPSLYVWIDTVGSNSNEHIRATN